MYILKANDVIKACAICNHLSNDEYENVSWRIKETGENVCIIHALAVGYDYRGQGLGFQYISTENIFYEVVGHRNFKMYEYIIRE